MGRAISEVLPFAIGVAISPVPIIAVILVLFSARARVNGPVFALGWIVGVAVISTVVYLVADAGGRLDRWRRVRHVVLGQARGGNPARAAGGAALAQSTRSR